VYEGLDLMLAYGLIIWVHCSGKRKYGGLNGVLHKT